MKRSMQTILVSSLLALGLTLTQPARAHNASSDLSLISALPVASVLVGAGASVAAPVMLSTAGVVLVVKAVEVTARGSVMVLENLSDGTRVSVELVGGGVEKAALAAGTLLTVSVIGTGTVLSAAGEAIAFIPNELGTALLYNERVSY